MEPYSDWKSSEYGILDLKLRPNENIQRMANFNGTLYVFTEQRIFKVRKKSALRRWVERIIHRTKGVKGA